MEKIGKNDFIDIYVLKTLNEIKGIVKHEIKLEKEREMEIDKKMAIVLKDLINANFKNLQMNPNGDMIYTLLPIVDDKENEKIRLSFALYYAALYYDNVSLLHDLLKENKMPCLFYNNPDAASVYMKIGYKKVGEFTICG